MVLFAIFMCLANPQPYIGRNCIMLSDRPVPSAANFLDHSIVRGAYGSLAACQRDLSWFEHSTPPGYVDQCFRREVPAWAPAE